MKPFTIVACVLLAMSLSGCAMKSRHYGSMVELSNQASINYSQQVLDAVVGIRERAELPTLYYIEAGQSAWGANYRGDLTAQIAPPWNANRTTLVPDISGGENITNSIQFNDFGAAAMSRVTAILAFASYPIEIGNGKLPNGALYTIGKESKDKSIFLLSTPMKEGGYFGITPETQFEFFKFARDITYWTRHAEPQIGDLESIAGKLFAFVATYSGLEAQLADQVLSVNGAEGEYTRTSDDYTQYLETVQTLETEARKTSADSKIYPELLRDAYKNRDMKYSLATDAYLDRQKKRSTLMTTERRINQVVQGLGEAIRIIKEQDPQGEQIDIAAIVEPFQERIDGIIAKDPKYLKEAQFQMPSTSGLQAQDSIDKIYRDRFESLPYRFDQGAQAQAQ